MQDSASTFLCSQIGSDSSKFCCMSGAFFGGGRKLVNVEIALQHHFTCDVTYLPQGNQEPVLPRGVRQTHKSANIFSDKHFTLAHLRVSLGCRE
ncbi:hypothetical protein EK904_001832, partial [Melospiza melodia maxima]